jgi:hypothetical protein
MDKQVAKLESVLAQLDTAHGHLLSLLKSKREALRKAEPRQITQLTRQENEAVQVISDLEKQRLELVGELTLAIDPEATQPLRLLDLAERLDEPARGRLLVLRGQLKQRIEQTQQELAVVKKATGSLVRHMQGLVQTIGTALTGGGLYSSRGSLPQGAMAMNTFNATA